MKIKIYKALVLPVVLYGYETLSPTLREECRLRVFENRMLRRIFEPKRDESGEWRRFYNEELHSLYHSPNMDWMIKCERMEEDRSVFKILASKPMAKRPLERPRHRWEDNVRIEIGVNMRLWVDLAQDRDYWIVFVNTALNLIFP